MIACRSECQAIVDSGATEMKGPKLDVLIIYNLMGAIKYKNSVSQSSYVVNCNARLPGLKKILNILT